MCGFIICADTYRVSEESFEIAHQCTARRGSPGRECQRVVVTPHVMVGHNTLPLSSSDPNHFGQPKVGGSTVSVFVGEIFNFKKFMSHSILDQSSDTELAVQVFEQFRSDLTGFMKTVHQFDGFWNYASYNHDDGDLIAFTDPLSQKPLYYRTDIRALGSDPYALSLLAPTSVNEVNLSNTLKFGYSPDTSTPWNEIRQVPPGHMYYNGALLQYWDWSLVERPESLEQAILDSVSLRTFSYKNTGILLSGGLDSSLIYTVLKRLHHSPAVFHVPNENDTHYVNELIALHGDTIQPLVDLSNRSDREVERLSVVAQRTPSDLGSLLLQYRLAHSVQGISVIYTGDGADELFGGYSRAREYDSWHSDVFTELPYYHFPRLDRVMMDATIEVRSPLLAMPIVAHAMDLQWSDRQGKAPLKAAALNLGVPESIVNRPKVALKSDAIRQDPIQHRRRLQSHWRDLFTGESA